LRIPASKIESSRLRSGGEVDERAADLRTTAATEPNASWRDPGRLLTSRRLLFALVALGIALRVAQYAADRSLWIDEAWLALNLIEKPVSALTGPLDFNQAAPPGFLLVEGALGKLIGYGEAALRLFPLLCGIISVPCFAWLARRSLSQAAAPLAVLLFAVADGLIYYSSELKPYETDVAAAVALLAAGVVLLEDEVRPRTAFGIAIGGGLLVSLSFPALLMLGGVAAALLLRVLSEHGRSSSPKWIVLGVWAVLATPVVAFAVSRVNDVRRSFESGSAGFLGLAGSSSPLHALNAMGSALTAAVGFPQQQPFSQVDKLTLVCALIGTVATFRRSRYLALAVVVPFALLFAASRVGLYPITMRTELFLVPAIVLLIAEGTLRLARAIPRRARVGTAALLAAIIAAGPVWLAARHVVHPRTHEEIKPVLEYVRDHWRAGDTLYVHNGAEYAFLYYKECKCVRLSPGKSSRQLWPLRPLEGANEQFAQPAVAVSHGVVLGRYFGTDYPRYLTDLDRVRHRCSVWFLYSHVNSSAEDDFIRRKLLPHMAMLGMRVAGIDEPGAHAYLYKMRGGEGCRTG
jgi:Dolichyl-phosphate-mannose-protein mannosyltransferase